MQRGINAAKLPDMKLTNDEIIELRVKILRGIALAFEKLVEIKKKTNTKFAFSKEGQIYFVEAKDVWEYYECK